VSEHKATITWKRNGPGFSIGQYSREHLWLFDGGLTLHASASPAVVPAPYSNASSIDPEEAFVASLASCHMLTFVNLAQRAGFVVESYEDEAIGNMTKNERRLNWVSTVTLRPRVVYGGDKVPTSEEEAKLHHDAHDHCFIANSVKTDVQVKPRPATKS
jgi:organic hydroperoxide reductase OsmC/OhrA